METKKKQFKMPHTFVIIGIIILFAVLLTWIIPAGSYTRFENEAGIKVIDPNDFNYIDKTPVNPLEIPLYIVKAFIKRIDLMLVIMFAGGAFHILTKTGALHAVVAKMAKVFSTRVYLFLPILTLVFGLICTTQGVNLFIAFAPIMVMMAFAMGLDSITGASIILLGGAIGFSTGPLNINTTIVAQKIAGLPLYSGVGYRFICFAVFYVITNIYLIRYALKIQKHPELSPMYELDKTSEFRDAADLDSFGKLDARKILIMLVFFASLILIVYGGIKLDWDMSETASVFLALAVIEGVLGGFGPSAISKEFLEGCKKMLGAAFIIGMAQAISSIMNAGHITDTVVHALANGLNFVPTILLGPAMLLANTIINVFLTSGSGQAAAVIPILAPLADLVGVTRQTAILSFNFGDGFCNYVLPTSTALMGIISAVNIPYDRWMKVHVEAVPHLAGCRFCAADDRTGDPPRPHVNRKAAKNQTMASTIKEIKNPWLRTLAEYGLITVSIWIMVIGIYFFKFPNHFAFGGVTGFSTVFSQLLHCSASTFTTAANYALLVLGFIFLGKSVGVRTVYATIVMSVSLQALDALVPMHGTLTDQPMLELVFAIMLPAIGSAILFNIGASSGGTDVIAMILKKYTSMNIGSALMAADVAAVGLSFVMYGPSTGLFSVMGLVAKSMVVDNVIENMNLCKCFNIVCEHPQPICNFIIHELNRSATTFEARGAYSDAHKTVIMTTMRRSQAIRLRSFIRQQEPTAFIMIENSSEIIGKGFSPV